MLFEFCEWNGAAGGYPLYEPDEGGCWYYQVFFPYLPHVITSVQLLMSAGTEATGTLTVEIQGAVYDVAQQCYIPDDVALCSGTYDISTIPDDIMNGTQIEVTFGAGYELLQTKRYAIVCKADNPTVDQGDVWWKGGKTSSYIWGLGGSNDTYSKKWYKIGYNYVWNFAFREYGTATALFTYTSLTGENFSDLKTTLDDKDIRNDVRVIVRSYDYTYELVDGTWYKYPIDLTRRNVDSDSINKYGRRSKIQNKHVMDEHYATTYCEWEIYKGREPFQKVNMKVLGVTDNITKILTTKVGALVGYQYTPAGLQNTALVDNFTLDVDLDQIPRLTLNLTDANPLDMVDWFNIDVDTIDNTTDLIR